MLVDLQYVDSKLEVVMWSLMHMGEGRGGGGEGFQHLT